VKRSRTVFAIVAMIAIAALLPPAFASQDTPKPLDRPDMRGLHDFDFLVGDWRVHSRKLKEPLSGRQEWIEFEGTISSRKLMEGRANVDDTVFNMPGGIYRGVAPRAYDPNTGQWAIWWIDGRNPFGNLDPPVKGRFVHGVGTFYADDTLRGKPIKVRFIWSGISRNAAHWEQAYSSDGGKTWETNWVQTLERVR
jgi:hypothetical protein